MPRYKVIDIYTSENARWRRRPVHCAVIEYVSSLKIPARAIVARGIEGAYEDGEIAAGGFGQKPVHTTIVLAVEYFDDILSKVQEMVTEGIVTARDVEVYVHRSHGVLYVQYPEAESITAPAPGK